MGDVFEVLNLAKRFNWVRICKVQDSITVVPESPVKIIYTITSLTVPWAYRRTNKYVISQKI